MANFNWHAVHTKLHCEQRVASLLTRKHIKNYCPVHEKESQGSEGKKIILEPLFTSYVFVYIRDEERKAVRNTPGVLNFLYWLNKPAIITVEEIDAITIIVKDYSRVRLEAFPLKIQEGEILKSSLLLRPNNKTENSIKVKLPSLGFYIIAVGKRENSHEPDR